MKISKLMHVISAMMGLMGALTLMIAVTGNSEVVFGINKLDALLCAGLLVLIAIWTQIATIHHMILDRRGEMV